MTRLTRLAKLIEEEQARVAAGEGSELLIRYQSRLKTHAERIGKWVPERFFEVPANRVVEQLRNSHMPVPPRSIEVDGVKLVLKSQLHDEYIYEQEAR